jgi:hypothetical protein
VTDWPTLISVWDEGKRGRWKETTETLALYKGSPEQTLGILAPTLVLGRWILADAWEHLSRPDSAAAVLELTLSQDRIPWQYRLPMRMVSPFAHRRLVLLYCQMGRLEDAHRHWTALEEMMTKPDPILRASVDDARDALAATDGISRRVGR